MTAVTLTFIAQSKQLLGNFKIILGD